MSPWEKLLERPHSRGHVVQLYEQGDELSLAANVSRYLSEGLKRGERALVVATPEHRELFVWQLERLGAFPQAALMNGRLRVLDAWDTLSQCMAGSQPQWALFESVVGAAIGRRGPNEAGAGLRAYGEMVGLLWNAGQFAAANRLEQLWNRLLAQSSFSLYCAYEIDIFGKDFYASSVNAILRAHTHVIPAQPDRNVEEALYRAMDEILGADAEDLKARVRTRRHRSWALMPNAETIVLGLREYLPRQAEDILVRARRHCLQ
jgi:DcmR-like sensory protein